jgi:hypothetical protein
MGRHARRDRGSDRAPPPSSENLSGVRIFSLVRLSFPHPPEGVLSVTITARERFCLSQTASHVTTMSTQMARKSGSTAADGRADRVPAEGLWGLGNCQRKAPHAHVCQPGIGGRASVPQSVTFKTQFICPTSVDIVVYSSCLSRQQASVSPWPATELSHRPTSQSSSASRRHIQRRCRMPSSL